MSIFIASDFHCKYQKVVWMNTETGEIQSADVMHEDPKAVQGFFSQFPAGSIVGMESSGYSHWFEEMVVGLGLELKIGNSEVIASKRTRRQKNDLRDAEQMLDLLVREEFPTVWRPSPANREQRKVLGQRCRLVRMHTQWANALRALAYNYNVMVKRGELSRKKREQIRQIAMSPVLGQQRDEMLGWMEQLQAAIAVKDEQIKRWVEDNPVARQLTTIPGIGPCTALAATLILGPAERFPTAKSVVAYVGLDCCEHSTDNPHKRRRYGHISKQGNRLLRQLLNQCATTASRHNAAMRRIYSRLCYRRDWRVAKTAVARKLLVCIYVLLRDGIDYPEFVRRGPGIGMLARTDGL